MLWFTFSDNLKIILAKHINGIISWLKVACLVLYCDVENCDIVSVENKVLIVQVADFVFGKENQKQNNKLEIFQVNSDIMNLFAVRCTISLCSDCPMAYMHGNRI